MSTEPISPHEPLIVTEDLPGIDGEVGPDPEHFCVEEVPLHEPVGEGEHLWVRIEKRQWTTPDAIRAIARAGGVDARDVGSAGMKDRKAVTSQWLSLPAQCRAVGEWQLPEGLVVLESVLHTHKLRTGQLKGNRFRLSVTARAPNAIDRARAICQRLVETGLPNYFGPQRFGYRGQNLASALSWLERGAPTRGKSGRFYAKLYPSVIQAEIFNRYLTARLRRGLDCLIEGEVVRLHGSGSVFVVDDPERELSRLRARDIHITGPMVGPKARLSHAPARDIEDAIINEIGLTRSIIDGWGRLAAGTWRDLLVFPEDLRVEYGVAEMLLFHFFLPAGSYASVLMRELSRQAA